MIIVRAVRNSHTNILRLYIKGPVFFFKYKDLLFFLSTNTQIMRQTLSEGVAVCFVEISTE